MTRVRRPTMCGQARAFGFRSNPAVIVLLNSEARRQTTGQVFRNGDLSSARSIFFADAGIGRCKLAVPRDVNARV